MVGSSGKVIVGGNWLQIWVALVWDGLDQWFGESIYQ